jgi:hypothetical protein
MHTEFMSGDYIREKSACVHIRIHPDAVKIKSDELLLFE